jgi:hypothetical protein
MKKTRKKSVWRKLGGALLFLLKGLWWILKNSAKAVWWLLKKIYFHAKKRAEKTRKPKGEATYSKLVELKKISGNLNDFEQQLLSSKSLIGIIIGARGSGKSALGARILENVRARGRRVAAMGFDSEAMPEWIQCVQDLSEVKNGSFLLVDEGGIIFSSRSAFSNANKLLSELLLISRHKDLSVLFISQNSANLDVNALRQADYLLFRKPSLLQKDFERKIVQKIYEERAQEFEQFAEDKGLTLVYAANYKGFVSNSLPSFWSEAASKSFKDFKAK